MSLNINGADGDGDHSWQKRAPLTLSLINRYKPDLIGFQECAKGNLAMFHEHLGDYLVLEGNCYGDTPQEHSSILYRASRYELLATGEFWFSETPGVESADWGVEYPMGATWVKLRCNQTGVKLLHLNTHYEDGSWGEQSRVNASRLIINRIAQLAENQPIVLTGDFNCKPWSEPYKIFYDHGFTDTYRESGNADSVDSSSFHAYKGKEYFTLEYGEELFWRVDRILTMGGQHNVRTTASTIVREGSPPVYPSDHYPILSEIQIV